jgi:hypothetical protein
VLRIVVLGLGVLVLSWPADPALLDRLLRSRRERPRDDGLDE